MKKTARLSFDLCSLCQNRFFLRRNVFIDKKLKRQNKIPIKLSEYLLNEEEKKKMLFGFSCINKSLNDLKAK